MISKENFEIIFNDSGHVNSIWEVQSLQGRERTLL